MRFFGHFKYFVALNDPDARFSFQPGRVIFFHLLHPHEGAEIVCDEDGWVKAKGSKRLCEQLKKYYRDYEDFGQPRVEDYRTQFVLCENASEAAGLKVRRVGPQEWVIKRRFTVQRVWLPEK